MYLAEEFLYLLIVLIGERYHPGIGEVTAKDCLKNELIQLLCIQTSTTRTELLKNVPDREVKTGQVDNILREIAGLKYTSSTDEVSYVLKPKYMDRYNMFSYHYTRVQRLRAEDTQRKIRKSIKGKVAYLPPPSPPPFTGECHCAY